MRTKVLLCAAALAASLACSMAQVYSLNVVGYYSVTVPQGGLALLANQLNTTNNQIQYLLQEPPLTDGTELFKFNGGFSATTLSFGVWDQPTWTMNPGEAAFILDPGTPGGQTLTFVGTVLQGSLTNTLPTDPVVNVLSYRASLTPAQTTITGMGVPAEEGDEVYVYNNGYSSDSYAFGSWGENGGNGPTINVGQGFAYLKAKGNTANQWIVNFTVQ